MITRLQGLLISLAFSTSACAYRFGLGDGALPGGYRQVAVPVFQNKSDDVGIEPYFTNAIIRNLNRSQAARVTNKDTAPLIMEGTILKVETQRGAGVAGLGANPKPGVTVEIPKLPSDTVLTSEYRLIVYARILLKRKSDDRVIWQSDFKNEKVYSAPRIGTPVVNSANALYNQSVRFDTITKLADEMMLEAHDRMTENF